MVSSTIMSSSDSLICHCTVCPPTKFQKAPKCLAGQVLHGETWAFIWEVHTCVPSFITDYTDMLQLPANMNKATLIKFTVSHHHNGTNCNGTNIDFPWGAFRGMRVGVKKQWVEWTNRNYSTAIIAYGALGPGRDGCWPGDRTGEGGKDMMGDKERGGEWKEIGEE